MANDFAGRVGVSERNRVHFASQLRDKFSADDLVRRPVASFDQMIGSHQLDKVQRGIFVKRDDAIDTFQTSENSDAVIYRIEWPVLAFVQSADRIVVVYSNK